MSDADKDKGAGPELPMLILGEDRPDVEDTTPEELRRQQEEARREIEQQRREAQEEIERRRREAEREIAELEAQKERELRQRERELERTQKKLYQRETQLLRKAATKGSTKPPKRLVPPPPRVPLHEKGLRRSALGITLGTVAALAIGAAGITAGAGADPELAAELATMDEARVLYQQSGLAADEAISLRMADRPVPAGDDGSVPGQAFADQAVALAPGSQRYGENVVERTEEMVAEGTSTVRSLTLWSQVRDEAGYAVGSWEVNDRREQVADQGNAPVVLAAIGLMALILLLAMACVAQSWLAVPALLVATGLGVATLPAVYSTVSGDVPQAAEDHDAASRATRSIYDQLGRDLQAAYGTSTSTYANRSEYWTDNPFYDVSTSPGLKDYLDAREAVGEAEGDDATFAAAAELVQAGRAAFEERLPDIEDARHRLVAGAEQSGPRATTVLLGLGSAVLAVTGVVLSGGRRETA